MSLINYQSSMLNASNSCLIVLFMLHAHGVAAQLPADPRPPGLYPYVPGSTLATVSESTWRAEGDQIILDYMLSNPINEAVAVRPVFRSKTRPDFRLGPKSLSGPVGVNAVTGMNHVVWEFKRDTPNGLPKDEYYFGFNVALVGSGLNAPVGTTLYTVVTCTQLFVVACPTNPNTHGILVVKGSDTPSKLSAIATGDSIFCQSQYSISRSGYIEISEGGAIKTPKWLKKGSVFIWNSITSCAQLGNYFSSDMYMGDIHANSVGTHILRGDLGLYVRRGKEIIYMGRKEGL